MSVHVHVCVIDFVMFHLQGFNSNIWRLVGCLPACTHTRAFSWENYLYYLAVHIWVTFRR